MKYIRTKDGRIIVNDFDEIKLFEDGTFMGFRLQKFPNYKKPKPVCYCVLKKDEMVKTANTIEEVCDCWIIIPKNTTCSPFVRNIKDDISHFINDSHIIYGAIWTDKGLIYVAKMNDKGELDLL